MEWGEVALRNHVTYRKGDDWRWRKRHCIPARFYSLSRQVADGEQRSAISFRVAKECHSFNCGRRERRGEGGRGCGESQRCAESRFSNFYQRAIARAGNFLHGRAISAEFFITRSRRIESILRSGRFRGGAAFFGDDARELDPKFTVTCQPPPKPARIRTEDRPDCSRIQESRNRREE